MSPAAGNPNAENVQEGAQQVQDEQVKAPDVVPKEEFIKLQSRYEESGKEAKRLAERLEKIEAAQQVQQEQKSSLTQREPSFPDEASFIKYRMENDDFTERQARAQYQVEKFYHNEIMAQKIATQALAKELKFSRTQIDRTLGATNPDLQKANEFFKDLPELAALPPADKLARYQTMMTKITPAMGGRDTSAIKGAASGYSGSGSGRNGTAGMDDVLEQRAKDNGFQSMKHMKEIQACTSQEDYDQVSAKWRKK